MLPCVLSATLSAGTPPLQFNASMFHAQSFSSSGVFANREIFVLDGSVDALAGGTASVTTPNATKISPTITFSEQYKISPMAMEWEVNATMQVGDVVATGRAILEPTNPSTTAPAEGWRVMEFIWQNNQDMSEWLKGPNPPPRPPPGPGTPTPAPRSNCIAEYDAKDCTAPACSWCASADGAHSLCFDAKSVPKLDATKWSCAKERYATPAPAADTCPGRGYGGMTYDVQAAAKTTSASTYDDCCATCTAAKTACGHWTFADGKCYRFSTPAPGQRVELFHADMDVFSGVNTQGPPGPPGNPTPPPAPTPAPSPPPAPVAPTPSPAGEKTWAVIVTGSQGYGNYRHHADACHAYQIVRKNGIPAEQIIMMMQDNVANDAQNPFPGKLFNQPTEKGTPGVDVYEGCRPDYTGKMVDGQLFMDVITGNTTDPTRTKVLKSGPKDKVFINFVDHGGGKIVAMPNGPYLTADVLNANIKTMHDKKMYDKLVFYMEACNSGSMWEGLLPDDMNVYVTTAANPTEPSWGTYCPPQDMVDGVAVGSCLGDLYSVNWMEDSDNKAGQAERLGDQFIKVRAETNKSHCLEYGTQDFKWTDHVSDFQGHSASEATNSSSSSSSSSSAAAFPKIAVDSRDIEMWLAKWAAMRATGEDARRVKLAEYEAIVAKREAAEARFARVFETLASSRLGSPSPEAVRVCERRVVATAEQHCGTFDSYSLKFTAPLLQRCRAHAHENIAAALAAACQQPGKM